MQKNQEVLEEFGSEPLLAYNSICWWVLEFNNGRTRYSFRNKHMRRKTLSVNTENVVKREEKLLDDDGRYYCNEIPHELGSVLTERLHML